MSIIMYWFEIICHNLWCTQGSLLGPLLFILYSNDLPGSLQSTTCVLFADDIYVSGKYITELYKLVSQDIASLAEWFKVNKLFLNINKTQNTEKQHFYQINVFI